MQFLLDTNICIYIIKKRPPEVWQKFQTLLPGDVGISSITVAELEYGVYKSQNPEKNQLALNQFLIPLEIIPFEEKHTLVYGEIRANLEQQGKIIGALDLLIAAQALAMKVVLVTNNMKEFNRIPNLMVENWLN
jgi:tRNA(fMet)-specific endonuclease VapC